MIDCDEAVTEVATVDTLPDATLVKIIAYQQKTIQGLENTIDILTKTNASQQQTISILTMHHSAEKRKSQVNHSGNLTPKLVLLPA